MLEVTALSSNTAKACIRACRAIFLIATSPKFAANSSTVDFNSATVLGCFLYTCIIAWLQNEKSMGDKSGEFGGQWCSVFLDKILSPNFDLKKSRHGRVTWLVAPSYWYQYCFLVATALTAGQSTSLRTFKYTSLLTEPSNHTTWRHFPSTMPVHAIHSSPVVLRHSASTCGFIGAQYRSFWQLGACCAF